MKIDLELFNHKHILKTYEWVSNLELRKQFLIRGDVTWEKHIEYFERALNDPTQRIYAILADGSHVGNCGFKNIKPSQKEGEVWIYIGESVMQRKGIGAKAVELLLHDGFEAFKFEVLYLHVADFNAPAIKLYKKLGFLEAPMSEEEIKAWASQDSRILRMELHR